MCYVLSLLLYAETSSITWSNIILNPIVIDFVEIYIYFFKVQKRGGSVGSRCGVRGGWCTQLFSITWSYLSHFERMPGPDRRAACVVLSWKQQLESCTGKPCCRALLKATWSMEVCSNLMCIKGCDVCTLRASASAYLPSLCNLFTVVPTLL